MDMILTFCTAVGAMILLGLTVTFLTMIVVLAGVAIIEFICNLFNRFF